MNKIKNCLLGISAWLMVLTINTPVLAALTEVSPEELADKFAATLKDLLIPIGSILLLIAVTIIAVKIITSANKPQERTEAISSLPYLLLGTGLLGGVMIIAGFLLNIMSSVGG